MISGSQKLLDSNQQQQKNAQLQHIFQQIETIVNQYKNTKIKNMQKFTTKYFNVVNSMATDIQQQYLKFKSHWVQKCQKFMKQLRQDIRRNQHQLHSQDTINYYEQSARNLIQYTKRAKVQQIKFDQLFLRQRLRDVIQIVDGVGRVELQENVSDGDQDDQAKANDDKADDDDDEDDEPDDNKQQQYQNQQEDKNNQSNLEQDKKNQDDQDDDDQQSNFSGPQQQNEQQHLFESAHLSSLSSTHNNIYQSQLLQRMQAVQTPNTMLMALNKENIIYIDLQTLIKNKKKFKPLLKACKLPLNELQHYACLIKNNNLYITGGQVRKNIDSQTLLQTCKQVYMISAKQRKQSELEPMLFDRSFHSLCSNKDSYYIYATCGAYN